MYIFVWTLRIQEHVLSDLYRLRRLIPDCVCTIPTVFPFKA